MEKEPLTLNDIHYEYIKDCWHRELSEWYETEVMQRQVAYNVPGIRERFQEIQPYATRTTVLNLRPSGASRSTQGRQQAAHRGPQFTRELEIMAGVLAYFEISVIRTSDHVAMMIRDKLVKTVVTEIEDNLSTEIGLHGEDGDYFALRYGVDTVEIQERRAQLLERRDMLSRAVKELNKVERQIHEI